MARYTCSTWLARAGVSPQIAQWIMRHSDPKLTQNLYTHLLISDLKSGTNKLADNKRQKATGDDGNSPQKVDTLRDTSETLTGRIYP